MDKLIDSVLGIYPQALQLGAKRLELIADNIANADTPGFKARDIDFRATLESLLATESGPATALRRTSALHQSSANSATDAEPLYRVPNLPSLDGNTVDMQMEQSAFSEASVRYQASLDFLNESIQGLKKALRGD